MDSFCLSIALRIEIVKAHFTEHMIIPRAMHAKNIRTVRNAVTTLEARLFKKGDDEDLIPDEKTHKLWREALKDLYALINMNVEKFVEL